MTRRTRPRVLSTVRTWALAALSQLRHQARVLRVEATLCHGWLRRVHRVGVPVNSAIASHMSSATADTANDVRCEVTLLRTVILAMAYTTTVLTDLVFVIAQSTVQSRELAELITLVVILPFWGRRSLK